MAEDKLTKYRFSFGPWNIHRGADPFGPPVREEFSFADKIKFYKQLGFDGVQFHDDDVVEDIEANRDRIIKKAKDPKKAIGLIVSYLNELLSYDKEILILGEMKPNEPMDQSYCPTTGHFIGLAYKTIGPDRVGVLIESAHSILAGLDPSDEMGYALWHDKLWGVHLNDQNGLKFDEDKTFGSVDLRRAFNQVWVLEKNGYGEKGEFIGLDVKAMRTQKKESSLEHLKNSREIFLALLSIVRSIDEEEKEKFVSNRDYERLEMYILRNLLRGK